MTPTPQPSEGPVTGAMLHEIMCSFDQQADVFEIANRINAAIAAKPSTREAEAPVSEAVACAWCDGRKTVQTSSTDFTVRCRHCNGTGIEDHPAPSPASAWKPIEEAPKDGTPIDIWVTGPGARRVPHCRWGTPSRANWGDRYGDDKNLPVQWETTSGFALDRRNGIATHWQPLPTPPATEGAGE